MTDSQFRVDIVGYLEYKDLSADIYFKDQFVAEIEQEDGFENLRIRLYPPKDRECWEFSFDEFQNVIQKTKHRLWELRRQPEEPES
ncbi:hypothetical protein [Estrella lausannensis]|uniref:hypothetical protein n=1 Tax=Estrella lausannensis TaxID=483423 RepID=UPI000BF20CF1|nr:hypothetical protein [Estrella lausannensis]